MRLVAESEDSHPSRWAAVVAVSEKIGCSAETLRSWEREAERSAGKRTGLLTKSLGRSLLVAGMGAGRKTKWLGFCLASLSATSVNGCQTEGECPLADLTYQCGFNCVGEGEGLLSGNPSISGRGSLDGALGSFVDLRYAAGQALYQAEDALGVIFDRVGLGPDASNQEISGAVEIYFGEEVTELSLLVSAPRCTVSAHAAAVHAEACETLHARESTTADSDSPGEGAIVCDGRCENSVTASSDCAADQRLLCRGVSPEGECAGACFGACVADEPSSCDGICRGACDGTCIGEQADGTCVGDCRGTCTGICVSPHGASCSGNCAGTCSSDAGGSSCSPGQVGSCAGESDAPCLGSCSGALLAPGYSAPCAVVGMVLGELRRDCESPTVVAAYEPATSLSPRERDDLASRVAAFEAHAETLVALHSRLEHLLSTCERAVSLTEDVIVPWIEVEVEGDLRLPEAIGLACALDELSLVEDGDLCETEALRAAADQIEVLLGWEGEP